MRASLRRAVIAVEKNPALVEQIFDGEADAGSGQDRERQRLHRRKREDDGLRAEIYRAGDDGEKQVARRDGRRPRPPDGGLEDALVIFDAQIAASMMRGNQGAGDDS